MRKQIWYDKHAKKELTTFGEQVQAEFKTLIELLSTEGKLDYPDAKK